jgi:hypothetical protein
MERVRETVRTGPWLAVYEDLSARDPASLAAVELDALAEAAWWLCKTDESIAVRHRAYAAFREARDDRVRLGARHGCSTSISTVVRTRSRLVGCAAASDTSSKTPTA